MRYRYWNNTNVVKAIRSAFGIPTPPKWATSEEWDVYYDKCKEASPFVHWLTDEFVMKVQNVVCWPSDVFTNVRAWFNNKFITKTHVMSTDLKVGQWHEFETRLLHGAFNELVNFVECEKAAHNYEYWKVHHRLFRRQRCVQAGLEHLYWETKLIVDDEWMGYCGEDKCPIENRPDNWGHLTDQAKAALEVLDLYVWWKYIRPLREDCMTASGYSEYFDYLEETGSSIFGHPKTPEDKLWQEGASYFSRAIEERYFEEDTEMLSRLINIRGYMWT